jgi:hypothetical protein
MSGRNSEGGYTYPTTHSESVISIVSYKTIGMYRAFAGGTILKEIVLDGRGAYRRLPRSYRLVISVI